VRADPGSPRDAAARLGLCLLAVAAAAKLVVLARQASPGDAWRTPWAVPAFLFQDVACAAMLAGIAWATRARWLSLGLYLGGVGWLALNVPVTAVMSSPITAGFLHAAGGPLGDSFSRYLSVANLGGGLAMVALGVALLVVSRHVRVRPVWLAPLLLLPLGPPALARVETRGLHRNAVLALVETTWRRGLSPYDIATRPCPSAESPGVDLRGLAGAARGRNVVWVILESTGARALAPYGAADVTPHLTALARGALVWERAYTAYPESIKGLFSMLCSRSPPQDAEASDFAARLPCASVGEVFRRAGYRTGLFHSGRFAYLGMNDVVAGRGFDVLADAATIPSRFTSSFGVDDRATAEALLRFSDGGRPFFAVYMPIAGHHPYHAPGEGPRPLAERSERDEYLNDLRAGDDAFGHLRAGLRARGLDERTLYVVMGDHGEAFREHPGNVAHALFLYEENVRVPLFAAAPGLLTARRVPQLASALDLAPTTLALAGLPAPAVYEGRSALDPAPRVARFHTAQAMRRAGLVDGQWKLLTDETGRAQLYDLAGDPDERHDLAAAHPDRVARYAACLE
jgi:arylsulfatase A-like enzyme